jgi:hypothetical protein
MSTSKAATPLNVFTVEEYEAPTGKNGTSWTKIGVAFPHHEGPGFNVELRALPTNGRWWCSLRARRNAASGSARVSQQHCILRACSSLRFSPGMRSLVNKRKARRA